jgi:hypothetical protein
LEQRNVPGFEQMQALFTVEAIWSADQGRFEVRVIGKKRKEALLHVAAIVRQSYVFISTESQELYLPYFEPEHAALEFNVRQVKLIIPLRTPNKLGVINQCENQTKGD